MELLNRQLGLSDCWEVLHNQSESRSRKKDRRIGATGFPHRVPLSVPFGTGSELPPPYCPASGAISHLGTGKGKVCPKSARSNPSQKLSRFRYSPIDFAIAAAVPRLMVIPDCSVKTGAAPGRR